MLDEDERRGTTTEPVAPAQAPALPEGIEPWVLPAILTEGDRREIPGDIDGD